MQCGRVLEDIRSGVFGVADPGIELGLRGLQIGEGPIEKELTAHALVDPLDRKNKVPDRREPRGPRRRRCGVPAAWSSPA
jgi:hypothetical protein